MAKHEIPLVMTLFLIFTVLIGLALNVLVFLDVTWLHFYLKSPEMRTQEPPRGEEPGRTRSQPELDQLRESILLVIVPKCDGDGASSGTSFVVEPGYVATAAHVISDHYSCDSEIRLVDSFGVEHPATADGYSDTDDIALLRISDTSIPQLTLADSRNYQEITDLVEVLTIGYPLVGAASEYDSAAPSGDGHISSFDSGDNRFITSGLNVNPGNSGGPVFIKDDWKVIGIASAKLDVSVGEGIGYIVPINLFKEFYLDTTGETLE